MKDFTFEETITFKFDPAFVKSHSKEYFDDVAERVHAALIETVFTVCDKIEKENKRRK